MIIAPSKPTRTTYSHARSRRNTRAARSRRTAARRAVRTWRTWQTLMVIIVAGTTFDVIAAARVYPAQTAAGIVMVIMGALAIKAFGRPARIAAAMVVVDPDRVSAVTGYPRQFMAEQRWRAMARPSARESRA